MYTMESQRDEHLLLANCGYPRRQRRLRGLRSILVRNMCPRHSITNIKELCRYSFFFTLHESCTSTAYYTSKKVSGTLNPVWENVNFASDEDERPLPIDLKSEFVCIRVWVAADSDKEEEEEEVMIRWDVNFSSLIPLEKDSVTFGRNVILFEFDHHVLCTAPFADKVSIPKHPPPGHPSQVATRSSYSLNSLKRLELTTRAINEVNTKSEEIRSIITAILNDKRKFEKHKSDVEWTKCRLQNMKQELAWRSKELEDTKKNFDCTRSVNEIDELASKERLKQLLSSWDALHENKKRYFDVREQLIQTGVQLVARRKQLLTDLASIYPITRDTADQVTSKTKYRVAGVHLPNSEDLAGCDEIMLGVALGYVCHLVKLISIFLDVPLRYPIEHKGSRSTIRDDIIDMLSDKERDFPLYAKGRERYQFDYAVYILNKNIVQLRHYCGMPTPNLGHTLPNLYGLLNDKLGVVRSTKSNRFANQHILVPPSFGGPLPDVAATSTGTPSTSTDVKVAPTLPVSRPQTVPRSPASVVAAPSLASSTVDVWTTSLTEVDDMTRVKPKHFKASKNSLIEVLKNKSLSQSVESLASNQEGGGFLKRTLKVFKKIRGSSLTTSPHNSSPSTSKFCLAEAPAATDQAASFTLSGDSSGFLTIDRSNFPNQINEDSKVLTSDHKSQPTHAEATDSTLNAVVSKLDDMLKISESEVEALNSSSVQMECEVQTQPEMSSIKSCNGMLDDVDHPIGNRQEGTSEATLGRKPAALSSSGLTNFINLMTITIETPDQCDSSDEEEEREGPLVN